MSDTLRVGLVQINTREDKTANLQRAEELIDAAAARGARFVALPEYVDYLGPKDDTAPDAETIPGEMTARFGAVARRHNIWLLGGSMRERSATPGKFYNSAVLYDPAGEIAAVYRKIHLFDIDLTGNVTANESATILPGDDIVTAEIDGHTAGLSICYDLRFPELYRALADRGAEVLLVPAAFTLLTGKDHWHVLLRARAIEAQCFVLAAAQWGTHPKGRTTYGHSLVADPWGTVIAEASDGPGVVVAELDPAVLARVRANLPSLTHRVLGR